MPLVGPSGKANMSPKLPLLAVIGFSIAGCASMPPGPTSTENITKTNTADHAAIISLLDTFFVAFHEKDVAVMTDLIIEPGFVRAVRRATQGDNAGQVTVSQRPIGEFPAAIAASTSDLLEVYWEPEIQTRKGLIAHAWTPFEVHVNGKRLQCGVNMFTLLATADGWKIADITYSAEPDGCDTLPPATSDHVRPPALQDDFFQAD